MLSVEEAQDRLLRAVGHPLPVEDVRLSEALDRVLADPIRAALDLPPWDNSSMDGFAVHAADVAGATATTPVRLRVVGDVRAGGSPHVDVPPGCAVRIATGAPMPASADAVVPVETTILDMEAAGSAVGDPASAGSAQPSSIQAGSARALGFRALEPLPEACLVTAAVEPGAFVRRRGEDVRAGTSSRASSPARSGSDRAGSGRRARPLRVHREPATGVLSTGDELRTAGRNWDNRASPTRTGPGCGDVSRRRSSGC